MQPCWTMGLAMLLAAATAPEAPKMLGEWPKEIESLACVKGEMIWVLNGQGIYVEMARGEMPSINPANSQVAYTSLSPQANNGEPRRQVKIFLFDSLRGWLVPFPDKASSDPLWSPDGRFLAMNVMTRSPEGREDWAVWTYEPATKRQRLASKAVPAGLGVFACSWSGPVSLLVQDTVHLYEVGADGTAMARYNLEPLMHGLALSSDTRFALSADRRFLYFTAPESAAEAAPWHVYKVALQAGEPMRLCPGSDFQLLAPGLLLVSVTHGDAPMITLHRESGNVTTPLVEFAWSPSAALKAPSPTP